MIGTMAKRPPGLKPGFSRDALRGAKAPLFHGTPGVRQRLFGALLLVTMVGALAPPAAAQSSRISNFQDTITVNPDGSAVVNETITLNFEGEWHGIHRTIPVEYPGPDGTNYQLFVKIIRVTDENGAKLKYDS